MPLIRRQPHPGSQETNIYPTPRPKGPDPFFQKGVRALFGFVSGWVVTLLYVATKNANKKAKNGKQKPAVTGLEKKIVATNRRARRDFAITDTYECGMVLRGSEVKSLRDAQVQMTEAYGRIDDGQMWLLGLNISPYASTGSSSFGHVPDRHRKLLLHRTEIDRIDAKVSRERLAIVALSIYFIGGRAKVEIGIAKGKKEYDRRQDIALRDANREADRAMSRANHRQQYE